MEENCYNEITRVLFCGPYFPASQKYTREYLQSFPHIQVDDVPLDDVPEVIEKYQICVVKNCCLDSETITRAKQMKLIMQFGVGLEGVDVSAATQFGIKVARIPGHISGNSVSCAEMAIYLILGLLKKQGIDWQQLSAPTVGFSGRLQHTSIFRGQQGSSMLPVVATLQHRVPNQKEMEVAVKTQRLGEPTGETLFGKTVFIMGYGAIGHDLATRLKPFGVRILATKRSWPMKQPVSTQPNGYGDGCPTSSMEGACSDDLIDKKGGPENLLEFAREADIVVTCLSLNQETVGIVNEKFLSTMKQGSLLVNIGRGRLLDYESIKHHLEIHHLGGLGLDVTWNEPFNPEDPIVKFPNVLITPHVAGVTEYSYRAMAKIVGDCALQLHAGDPLTGLEFVN